MKKFFKILGLGLLAIILIGSLVLAISDPTIPVTITDNEAQTMVNKKMPFSKTIDVKIPILKDRKADVLVESATLDFLENGAVQITSLLEVKIDGRYVKGYVNAESAVDYRSGEFYLDQVAINKVFLEEYELTEKDKKLINSGKKAVDLGKKAISKWNNFIKKEDKGGILEEGISEDKIAQSIKNTREKIIKKIETIVIDKIQNIPVYKLDSSKTEHNIAKLMLKDIKVNDTELVVTMSVGKLVSTIWLYIIAGIASVIMAFGLFFGAIRGGVGGIGISDIADL